MPRHTQVYQDNAIEAIIRHTVYEWFSGESRPKQNQIKVFLVDDMAPSDMTRCFYVSIDPSIWLPLVQDTKKKVEALVEELNLLFEEIQLDYDPICVSFAGEPLATASRLCTLPDLLPTT
jgi:hypothetical protein